MLAAEGLDVILVKNRLQTAAKRSTDPNKYILVQTLEIYKGKMFLANPLLLVNF